VKQSRSTGPGDEAESASGPEQVAVEEIFLEGENAAVLFHRAGSDQASRLLEDSGIHELLISQDGTD
jgi:hypothetical protein